VTSKVMTAGTLRRTQPGIGLVVLSSARASGRHASDPRIAYVQTTAE
jgi:hypothetical protein